MSAPAIVSILDPGSNFPGRAVAGGPNPAVVELCFQRREEALSDRVDAPMLSIRAARGFVLVGKRFQDGKDFACEVSFEAADDVSLAFPLRGAVL